jgi:hypothetical protein
MTDQDRNRVRVRTYHRVRFGNDETVNKHTRRFPHARRHR